MLAEVLKITKSLGFSCQGSFEGKLKHFKLRLLLHEKSATFFLILFEIITKKIESP
jgi:hypothetical protein